MIKPCPSCGVKNRVPPEHLAEVGRCGSCKAPLPAADQPIEVDAAVFDEIARGARVPILVDFWAAWCGPCRMSDCAARALEPSSPGSGCAALYTLEHV